LIQMLIAVASMAPNLPPPPRQLPEISVMVLSPEANGPGPLNRDYLVRRARELLATMHDQGIVSIRFSDVDPKIFSACLATSRIDREEGERRTDDCIRAALPAQSRATTVAVVIRRMRWRSAAQQMTCIAADRPGVGRNPIHLGDIFHRYDYVRAAARVRASECLATALDHRDAASK
jgi:hypothetical protein